MFVATNPTTGHILHEYAMMDSGALESAIDQSAKTYAIWRKEPFEARAAILTQVAQLLRQQEERLARLMTDEMGKPIKEARGEVQKSAWCAEHYAQYGAEYLAPKSLPSDASHSYVQHLPLGAVLGVLPWNAPFW
ncbi:MAG: aldehyde dehydrogenase family protein, partial [Gammaproteobacteria bacterium]